MTAESRIHRIRQSIAECERFIAKEGPRDAALRPADMQKALDHAIAHRARLLAMLDKLAEFSVVLYVDSHRFVAMGDTFVAIGEFGGADFRVPRGHAWFDRIAECDDTLDGPSVLAYHRELVAALA